MQPVFVPSQETAPPMLFPGVFHHQCAYPMVPPDLQQPILHPIYHHQTFVVPFTMLPSTYPAQPFQQQVQPEIHAPPMINPIQKMPSTIPIHSFDGWAGEANVGAQALNQVVIGEAPMAKAVTAVFSTLRKFEDDFDGLASMAEAFDLGTSASSLQEVTVRLGQTIVDIKVYRRDIADILTRLGGIVPGLRFLKAALEIQPEGTRLSRDFIFEICDVKHCLTRLDLVDQNIKERTETAQELLRAAFKLLGIGQEFSCLLDTKIDAENMLEDTLREAGRISNKENEKQAELLRLQCMLALHRSRVAFFQEEQEKHENMTRNIAENKQMMFHGHLQDLGNYLQSLKDKRKTEEELRSTLEQRSLESLALAKGAKMRWEELDIQVKQKESEKQNATQQSETPLLRKEPRCCGLLSRSVIDHSQQQAAKEAVATLTTDWERLQQERNTQDRMWKDAQQKWESQQHDLQDKEIDLERRDAAIEDAKQKLEQFKASRDSEFAQLPVAHSSSVNQVLANHEKERAETEGRMMKIEAEIMQLTVEKQAELTNVEGAQQSVTKARLELDEIVGRHRFRKALQKLSSLTNYVRDFALSSRDVADRNCGLLTLLRNQLNRLAVYLEVIADADIAGQRNAYKLLLEDSLPEREPELLWLADPRTQRWLIALPSRGSG